MESDDTTLAEPSPLDTDEIPVLVVDSAPRPAWSKTWALGGVAVVLVVFEALSGLVLLFHYRPLIETAYLDLVDLVEASRFAFARELHRWGSHLLVIIVALHLFRVVITGSYREPRRFNYQIGIVLGLVVLLAAITGHILPWDRQSQWLNTLLTSSGIASSDLSLTVVFAWHCGLLPALGAGLILYHLKRSKRDEEILAKSKTPVEGQQAASDRATPAESEVPSDEGAVGAGDGANGGEVTSDRHSTPSNAGPQRESDGPRKESTGDPKAPAE